MTPRRMVGAAALAVALAAPGVAHADARSVALSDARTAPAWLAMVAPGGMVDARPGCRLSDVNAYRWNGRALGPQRVDVREGLTYWRPRGSTRRVGWDGRTFYNGTRVRVLVAAWCG